MRANTVTAPNPPVPSPNDLLTDREAARYLNIALQTVRNFRWRHCGPRYYKIGERSVRYRRRDLDAFVERGASSQDEAA